MGRILRVALLAGLGLAVSMPVLAQSAPPPASTTVFGDSGLWFLPIGEVLPRRGGSFSVQRVNYDREQGFSDISHLLVTFGIGISDRVELFESARFLTRIDRDIRPLFTADPAVGGVLQDFPHVNSQWVSGLGDIYVGAKFNILSEQRDEPAAFAVRAMVKIPTGSTGLDGGTSTGEPDVHVDAILSRKVSDAVELTGLAGVIVRGDPDDVALSNSFTWGVGAGFPTRSSIRVFTELRGQAHMDDQIVDNTGLGPPISLNESTMDANVGVQWQSPRGIFVGVGLNWSATTAKRSDFGSFDDTSGDRLGFLARIGYHPGSRSALPPVPVAPPPPPPAPGPSHQLTVEAECDPCTVEVGGTSTVTAQAQSSIGCSLTYRWNAPTGTFANASQRQTMWTAPNQEGGVPVTVTATCPTDNLSASDTVTIQVVRPAVRSYMFEDVHFDFDRFSLRPGATRALDEAVAAMMEDASLSLEIEGHTCNIGTAEYNMALGDRRAGSVRDYLISRGIAANRLRTVSYGEERPMHDNSREETRRLNRRAALVVRLQ